jgi:pimeloyl-ACP methyl ester carboxylesterase
MSEGPAAASGAPPPRSSRDPVERFLVANTPERFALIKDPEAAGALRAWLGDDAYAEYFTLSRRLSEAHLGYNVPPNLIFVPGVMGSLLASRGLVGIWWIDVQSRHHINDLRLAADGRSDANPGHDIAPVSLSQSYEAFLAAVLGRQDFGHVSFPYDWRKPLTVSEEPLRDAILSARSRNGRRPVHLVAHSMGGLLVRATLLRHPELWRHIGKIVFLGTPHYGSPAIAGYLKNHLWGFNLLAVLGHYLDRITFRSLWGVIGLLPAPAGVYPGTRRGDPLTTWGDGQYRHPCANFDLYRASEWHLDFEAGGEERLQTVLDAAAGWHRELYDWHLGLDQAQRDRMLVIAGVGFKTLFRVAYKKRFGFLWDHMDRVTSRRPSDAHREGDGRVPLSSAALESVGQTRYAKVEHGSLPTVSAIYEDVFRFLNDQPMQLPTSIQDALQAHLAADPMSSVTPALAGVRADLFSDDPGYLQMIAPDQATVADIEQALANDRLPAFNRMRIL